MRPQSQHLLRSIYIAMYVGILWGCHDPDNVRVVEDTKSALHDQINKLRTNGCMCGNVWMPPVTELVWNTALEDAALDHATDMYVNNYFSHLSLDGTPPIRRAESAGYPGDYVGEVIAREYYTVSDVIEAWKGSESHCTALMDSLYNELGGARKEQYWVVDLGKSN